MLSTCYLMKRVFSGLLLLSCPVLIYAALGRSLACPEIELPSITGPKSTFRYIDAGCETSLTIRPDFGVSGGLITGYGVSSIPYAPPFPFDVGTPIFINKDDVWGDVVSLPFKFCFFENTYTQAVVGANGLISFNTSVANKSSYWALGGKGDIPSTSFLGTDGLNWGNAIYGVFEDIDPHKISSQHTNGSIRYGILGNYPCRTLTVSWYKVPNFSCEEGSKYWESFQIVMYEGTNVIDVYVNHRARCSSWNLGRGIIGIQNKTCTKAIAAPHRNTTDSWSADREAWRFSPISTPQYTITYYSGMGVNGPVLGHGDQVTINPEEVDAITVRLEFTAANGDRFDLRDTAVIARTIPEHVVTDKTICANGSYDWRGKTYTESGTYTEGVGYDHGCYEKIYQLNLDVNKNVGTKITAKICNGEYYTWHNNIYFQSGTYTYETRYPDGCRVTDTLALKICEQYHFYQSDTICAGESYTWRGKSYTASGEYNNPFRTKDGCDSIYTLRLVVGQQYLFPTTAKVCQGKSYRWRGKSYKEAGVYYDSLHTVFGCDSVYRLNLSVAPNYTIEEYDTICRGETFAWHGGTYTNEGTYYDNLTSRDGCDSIHILHLYVNKTYHFVEENTLRLGSTFRWRNRTFTTPGQYYDSLKTNDGCDSVYQLNLSYVRSQLYVYPKYICEGESFQWRQKTYNETGIYSDSLKNIHGEDSVYQLHLTVGVPIYNEDYATICAGESYEWYGRKYTASGTYDHIVEKKKDIDCGAFYQLHLTVGETFHEVTKAQFCKGGKYNWRGFDYSKPGIYYDDYQTVLGCDSIYELQLEECRTYFIPTRKILCSKDDYQWRGKHYSSAGVYWDSLTTKQGCDSVYVLYLEVEEPYTNILFDTICVNEAYNWRNKVYEKAGTYYDSLLSKNGCDSVYVLHLHTKPVFQSQERATICENETYSWRGNKYSQTDTYYEYLTSYEGCDSIYSLVLTVMPTYMYHERAYICSGEAYSWHGRSYSTPGVYRDTIPTVLGGCDSIFELTLGVSEHYYFEEEYSTCEGSYYSWHGQEITEDGVYWDSLMTVYGCDSIYRLTITFHPIYHFVTETTICQGESYAWRDSIYAIDSVYYDELSTVMACDSLYELRLTVLPTYQVSQNATFCQGDTFLWHGRELTVPGIYYDSLHTTKGCDSIYQLELGGHSKYAYTLYDTICHGEKYIFDGRTMEESGQYIFTYPTNEGCDSTYTIHLYVREFPVPILPLTYVCADEDWIYITCAPEVDIDVQYTVVFNEVAKQNGFQNMEGVLQNSTIRIPLPKGENGQTLPNTYIGEIQLYGEFCKDSFSYEFTIEVLYATSTVVQKFDDVLAVLNENYNGGYVFSEFQWYADGELLVGENMPYYYGRGVLPAEYYQVRLTRASDGVSMLSCPIIPQAQGIELVQSELSLDYEWTIMRLYSLDGTIVAQHSLQLTSINHTISLPVKAGMYILQLQTKEGKQRTYKLLIR